MKILDWFRPTPTPEPDLERIRRLIDNVEHAANIVSPPMFGKPRRWIVRYLGDAQVIADFYASTWFRDSLDAELFALEAAIAEESVA